MHKSQKHSTKSRQNNSPELLNFLFKHIFHENGLKMQTKCLTYFARLIRDEVPRFTMKITEHGREGALGHSEALEGVGKGSSG